MAESIFASAVENQNKIKEINSKLTSQTLNPEEQQALQMQLAILQANLQVDVLKLQAFSIMKSEKTQSKDKEREEKEQKNQEALQQTLQDKLDKAKAKVKF
ncbi:MAG: type IV secretion system protein VirB5, partial [Bartonella sp.]|nr:type IV secretion system protein VirB5 [Bartonella sp.]